MAGSTSWALLPMKEKDGDLVAAPGMTTIYTIQVLVLLLIVVAAVAVISVRLQVPAAILLVLTGIGLALTPGLPAVAISPDIVLLIVLKQDARPQIKRLLDQREAELDCRYLEN